MPAPLTMTSDNLKLSIETVCRLALPLGTTILTGGDQMSRPVRWVVSVNTDAAAPYLEGGELVLLMPSKGDPTSIIRACAEAKVAALVSLPPISPITLSTASMLDLPVLQLPADSRLRSVERTVIGFLIDKTGHIERRGIQIYQQLIQLASQNIGLEQIIHELSRFVNKAVVVQDKRQRIQVAAILPEFAGNWDEISELLTDRNTLPATLQDRHKLPRNMLPAVQQSLREDGLTRLVTPIVNQNVGRGYLSFIGSEGDFDDLDSLVIDHGAVVCALEMARAKAISEIEKKLRGDFLDSLMIGTVGETEAIAEGDRFGHDMNVPHVALVLMWYGSKHPSNRRLETLVNGLLTTQQSNMHVNTLIRLRDNELRIFCGSDSPSPIPAARQLGEEIRAEARREYPDARLAIGIGSVATRVNDWRTSYREAVQASDIARRLQSDMPMFIGDLGIYTFLAHPDYREDLRRLRDSTIGNLIAYEERQHADLLQTLEAFFQCHGNHTQTAELLSVHRNTLFYRMGRIAEITGLDLNQPDVRLAVHLALKIHRLLTTDG